MSEGHPYNPLQQLSYFAVVFLLGPLTIATGAALIARFPWYARLFGGKQAARSIHFLCLVAFVLFTVGHTAMVIIHGLPTGFAKIVLGSGRADHAEALWIGFLVLAALLLGHVAVTRASIRHGLAGEFLCGDVDLSRPHRLVGHLEHTRDGCEHRPASTRNRSRFERSRCRFREQPLVKQAEPGELNLESRVRTCPV